MGGSSERALQVSKARVEALTDGVFAIAATVLVMNLRGPIGAESDAALGEALRRMFPQMAVYGVSFVVLTAYWIGHHHVFDLLERIDRPVVWLNALHLMMVTLIPFSQALVASNRPALAYRVFALNLVALSASLSLLLAWAARGRRLLRPETASGDVAHLQWRVARNVTAFVVAIAVSYVDARWTPGILLLGLLSALFGRRPRARAHTVHAVVAPRGGRAARRH